MLGPLDTKLYADAILSGVSVAYQNAQHIADTLFPEVQVNDKTGLYWKYGKEKFTPTNDIRAPGTYAQVVNYSLTQASYGPLLDHSLDARIEDEIGSVASAPLDPGFDATEMLTERIKVGKEIDAYNQCSNTSVVTQNMTISGTSRWDDYANSDPIGDIRTAVDTVKKATIKSAKDLSVVLGYEVYSILRNHPQILDRIKWSNFGVVSTDDLAQVFGVKQVLIAESETNTAGNGLTPSMNYIWGKNAWVMLIADRPAPRTVSFGYTLRKDSRKVFRFRDDRAETDYIRVKDYYQQMIMASDAGYYLATVVN